MGDLRELEWLTATVFAHRGLHGSGVPENSLAAAQAAIVAGLGIECDVQRNADEAAYVFHDWDLVRLTGRSGNFSELNGSDVAMLKLGQGDEAPTPLKAFLDLVAGRSPILIEIKSMPSYDVIPTCAQVMRALEDYDGPHAIMSFDPRAPEWFAGNSPETIRGLVGTDSLPNGFEHVWRNSDSIEQAHPDFLAVDRRDLTRREAKAWRGSGKPLLSWTIRTAEERNVAQSLADSLIVEGDGVP